jgi:hypothetical protein
MLSVRVDFVILKKPLSRRVASECWILIRESARSRGELRGNNGRIDVVELVRPSCGWSNYPDALETEGGQGNSMLFADVIDDTIKGQTWQTVCIDCKNQLGALP